jgi:uncharacterized membrane protein
VTDIKNDIHYDDRITEEDRGKLISLLDEYSEKLKRRCDLIDKQNNLIDYIILLAIVFIGFVLSGFAWLYYVSIGGYYLYHPLLIIPLLVAFFIAIITVLFTKLEIIRTRIFKKASDYEADSLAYRLYKLVGMASQFHEQVETRRMNKIELDLKITEAELVLDHYERTIGQPKKRAARRI